MTLREVVAIFDIDNEPMEAAFMIAGILRSANQGEASTFEGDCGVLVEWSKLIGPMNKPENVRKLLIHLDKILDIEIPNGFLANLAHAAKIDEQNDLP